MDELGPFLDDLVVVVVRLRRAVVLEEDDRDASQVAKLDEVGALLTFVGTQAAAVTNHSDKLAPDVAETADLNKMNTEMLITENRYRRVVSKFSNKIAQVSFQS